MGVPLGPKQHATPPLAPQPSEQEHTKIAMAPLAWRAALPPNTALISYVDVDTLELVELWALSANDMTALVQVSLFAKYAAQWQTMSENRLVRFDFPAATHFAQNSHPVFSLGELRSHRWQASTVLAQIDQTLQLAKQQYDASFTTRHDKSIDDCLPLKQGFLVMQDLRPLTRQINAAFLQLGVPPPNIPPRPS